MHSIKTERTRLKAYQKIYNKPFRGWDFSEIFASGSAVESPLEWNYYNKIMPLVAGAGRMLDMGTGGGEFLKTLRPLPKQTYATESFKPNIAVACRALKPLGVKVISNYTDEELPFESGYFDLVINRHESYSPAEVIRILKSGGVFITQQVGGRNDLDIYRLLGKKVSSPYLKWNLKNAARSLGKAGFAIKEATEATGYTRFFSMTAFLRYLRAAWFEDGFTVEKYFKKLLVVEKRIAANGFLDIGSERFLIRAVKPIS